MLKAKEVMERLNIGRSTLTKLVKSGELPFIKIGRDLRFREKDVARLAEEGTGTKYREAK